MRVRHGRPKAKRNTGWRRQRYRAKPWALDTFSRDLRVRLDGITELVRDAEGNPRPDRHGLLDFVVAKDDGQWQIMVMHNLDLTALPSSTVSPTTTNR